MSRNEKHRSAHDLFNQRRQPICHFFLVACVLVLRVCASRAPDWRVVAFSRQHQCSSSLVSDWYPWRVSFSLQADLEGEAAGLVGKGDLEGARSMLAHHTNDSAIAAVSSYHTLFDTLVARYHDGYQMQVGNGKAVRERERERERGREGAGEGERGIECACFAVKCAGGSKNAAYPWFWWRRGGFAPVSVDGRWVTIFGG